MPPVFSHACSAPTAGSYPSAGPPGTATAGPADAGCSPHILRSDASTSASKSEPSPPGRAVAASFAPQAPFAALANAGGISMRIEWK